MLELQINNLLSYLYGNMNILPPQPSPPKSKYFHILKYWTKINILQTGQNVHLCFVKYFMASLEIKAVVSQKICLIFNYILV